jgi:four helix bundle protein
VDANELKTRTRFFALKIIKLTHNLPSHGLAVILGRQLLGCGTSVGANYRAACRAKSRADFIAKMKIVEEECDESIYWMELLRDANLCSEPLLLTLIEEAGQILSIIVASIRTARMGMR